MSRATLPSSFNAPSSHITRVFGAHPFHTDGDLLGLAFAADGTLWSVEEPGVVRRWDLDGRRQLGWHHLEELATVWAFSAGARHLASATDDLSVWDAAAGELEASWPQPCWVTALGFSPAADVLAAGYDDGRVRLWNWHTQTPLWEINAHQSAVSAVAFSADGCRLATAGEDRVIHLWDAPTAGSRGSLVGHSDRIPALVWHPNGHRLYSAGWDTTARVWDVERCEPIILLNSHTGQVHALALSADGSRLACADAAFAVHIWDTNRHREMHVMPPQAREVRALAFTPDGRRLASGGADHIIHVWDCDRAHDGGEPADLPTTRASVALSPDSRRLSALGAGATLGVWRTEDAAQGPGLQDAGELRAFAASPDGRWIAGSRVADDANGSPATLTLWDVGSGRRVADLEGQAGPVTALAFSADCAVLATGGLRSSDIWLWSIPDGNPMLLLPDAADQCSVEALAFHPAMRIVAVGGIDWMATSGADGCIALWDLEQRKQIAAFRGGAVGLAFHPNGRRLAVASLAQTIRVYDLDEAALAAEWPGHTDAVTCAAYRPDGRLLATGGDDHTVRLWDPETGAARGVADLDTQVKALCFSADGRRLYTSNGNGSCYELDVPGLLAEGS
ncbi:MAG TPA: WD40 repeat domain-containing protein [Gemmataceae bacterium]|nr:WD40 repeat domain-containing protein [Gemmataceae bacterium]